MSFPKDFPKDGINTLVNAGDQSTELIALALYDIAGYALGVYFGDVKYPAGLDFNTLSKLAEGADVVSKIKARTLELKKSGVGIFVLIVKLLAEFGPVVLQLVQAIRELFAKPTPALPV